MAVSQVGDGLSAAIRRRRTYGFSKNSSPSIRPTSSSCRTVIFCLRVAGAVEDAIEGLLGAITGGKLIVVGDGLSAAIRRIYSFSKNTPPSIRPTSSSCATVIFCLHVAGAVEDAIEVLLGAITGGSFH